MSCCVRRLQWDLLSISAGLAGWELESAATLDAAAPEQGMVLSMRCGREVLVCPSPP